MNEMHAHRGIRPDQKATEDYISGRFGLTTQR
jgi:hypothetical protein